MVDVIDKQVQRQHTLAKTPLDFFPFRDLDNSGDDVEGKDALCSRTVAVNRERYARSVKCLLGGFLAGMDFGDREFPNPLGKWAGSGAWIPGRRKHLVVKIAGIVVGERHGNPKLFYSANRCMPRAVSRLPCPDREPQN